MARDRDDQAARIEAAHQQQLAELRSSTQKARMSADKAQRDVLTMRKELDAVKAALRMLEVERRVAELESILSRGLERSPVFDWSAYLRRDEPAPPQPWETAAPEPPQPIAVPEDASWRRLREMSARRQNNRQQLVYQAEADHYQARLASRRNAMQAYQRKVDERQALWDGVRRRDGAAVASFIRLVLCEQPLPEGVPRTFQVAHSPHEERVVVRTELPTISDILPRSAAHGPVARSDAELDRLHRSVVSQVALLQVREVFGADPEIERVELQPVGISTDRRTFDSLGLSGGPDAAECLRRLELRA